MNERSDIARRSWIYVQPTDVHRYLRKEEMILKNGSELRTLFSDDEYHHLAFLEGIASELRTSIRQCSYSSPEASLKMKRFEALVFALRELGALA